MRTEDEKKAMKITLKENSSFQETNCFICGGSFQQREIAIIVLQDDPFTYSNGVCEMCLRAGPGGMRTRALKHAHTVKHANILH